MKRRQLFCAVCNHRGPGTLLMPFHESSDKYPAHVACVGGGNSFCEIRQNFSTKNRKTSSLEAFSRGNHQNSKHQDIPRAAAAESPAMPASGVTSKRLCWGSTSGATSWEAVIGLDDKATWFYPNSLILKKMLLV